MKSYIAVWEFKICTKVWLKTCSRAILRNKVLPLGLWRERLTYSMETSMCWGARVSHVGALIEQGAGCKFICTLRFSWVPTVHPALCQRLKWSMDAAWRWWILCPGEGSAKVISWGGLRKGSYQGEKSGPLGTEIRPAMLILGGGMDSKKAD